MNNLHSSAKPSHYNKEAKDYDLFNEKNSASINQTLTKILKKYNVKTVLDMTCGTGSQVFWLTKKGFEVVGSDINEKMLKIARSKAKKENLKITFIKGDMCTLQVGKFDAVITIFNAIGHLTKADFEKAMQNIYKNLNKKGLYIFDIFNLNHLLKGQNITNLTIDWYKKESGGKSRIIQYSTINEEGILTSYTTCYSHGNKVIKSKQTLQIYTARQLAVILDKNGFKVLHSYAIDGSRFIEDETDRILMIAQKK